MSSTVPARFSGIASVQPSTTFGSRAAVISVAIKPGAMALQRMPREPNSNATDFVKPMIPAFDAA